MYYKQNYKNIIKAVEMGLTPKQASVDPKKMQGLARPSTVEQVGSNTDKKSTSQRLLDKMREVRESNKSMVERAQSMKANKDGGLT